MSLQPSQPAPSFEVATFDGGTVSLEQFSGRPLLLMFHRYAGCPMCNIRLHDFAKRFPAWHERGLEAVAFFHSSPEYIAENAGGRSYPFFIAADPKFRVYRKYGVCPSWPRLAISMMRPSVLREGLRAWRKGFRGGRITKRLATMPADFLIGSDGIIREARYGRHIADHLSAGEIDAALGELSE